MRWTFKTISDISCCANVSLPPKLEVIMIWKYFFDYFVYLSIYLK